MYRFHQPDAYARGRPRAPGAGPRMPIDQPTLVRALLRDRARLHGFIWAIVRDEDLAEDVLQEVMLLALAKRETIDSESQLPGWTRKAARFKSFEALRRKHATPVTLDDRVIDLLEQ